MRRTIWAGCLMLAVAVAGCGSAGAGEDELMALATKAEAEFTKRGEGTFVDTGYASYCRTNTGFDEGVFKQIGFAPAGKGYQYCYNVSSDQKKLGVSATAMKDGSARCLIIDASSGKPVRGKVTETSSCTP